MILLANVGNSDLQIDPKLLPPRDDHKRWTTRAMGEELYDHLAKYKAHLQMPLLMPTLRWLHKQPNFDLDNLRIYLFASDQPLYTALDERAKDTMPHAKTVRSLLMDGGYLMAQLGLQKGLNIAGKAIRIETIKGSPADYANMLDYYTKILPAIAHYISTDAPVFLEVSGGTPAMTAMLMVAAVEVFGPRTRTLYVERGATLSYEVGVADQLFRRRTAHTLRTQIDMYAYAVALRTLTDYGELVIRNSQQREMVQALVRYADRRLAFDFEAARGALQDARRLAVGETQALIQFWLNQFTEADAAVNLAELWHNMCIKERFGDYADFLQRVFRFQEGMLHHIVEQLGVQFKDNTNERIDTDWLEQQPELVKFARTYKTDDSKNPLKLNLHESLSRNHLLAIADFFIDTDNTWAAWRTALEQLHGLSPVAELRNRGLSGHGFAGISRQQITEKYGHPVDFLMETLAEIYQAIFQMPLGESPYTAVNQLLTNLLDESVS